MSEVKVNLSAKDEIALLNRYGRRCEPPTLIKRAVAEVLRMQAEDVPVFEGKAAYEARVKAEAEAAKQRAEESKLSPEVDAILFRFRSGEKFVDGQGREVTALEPAGKDPEADWEGLPLLIQVGGDNSEWYPVELSDLKSAVVCICGHDGKLVSADCPVPAHAADAVAQGTPGIGDPEREFDA